MKKPENLIKRGEGNCTDYNEAIDAIRIYAQQTAIEIEPMNRIKTSNHE